MDERKPNAGSESESVIEDVEGGDPGVTASSVEKARRAKPEQAPDLPPRPPESKSGDRNRPRRAGPSG